MTVRVLLTLKQAAEEIGVSPLTGMPVVSTRSLREQIRRGDLAATRVGRDYLIAVEDLDDWLAARRTGGDR